MRRTVLNSCLVLAVAFAVSAGTVEFAQAQTAAKGPSGLPLPRFVTLKSKRVNLRIGPGTDYAVSWLYLKSGLPVEIIQEYDNWRRIRDADGTVLVAVAAARTSGVSRRQQDDRECDQSDASRGAQSPPESGSKLPHSKAASCRTPEITEYPAGR